MQRCEKHDCNFTQFTPDYADCVKCRKERQDILCAQGHHNMAPPRGSDGMRWCYNCYKAVDPDSYFAEAVGMLIERTR